MKIPTMSGLIALLLGLLLGLLGAMPVAAGWQPDPADKRQTAARATLDRLLAERPELRRYVDDAHAMAIFPTVGKAALMWGVTYGRGIVVAGNTAIGRCSQSRLDLGPQAGGRVFSQVIFFRNEKGLAEFQKGRLEFQGQAGVALATAGAHTTPAHLPEVAIFTLTKFGVIAEAAAGPTKFGYSAL